MAVNQKGMAVNQTSVSSNPIWGAKFLPLRVHPHFRLTASRHISTEMASIWGCGSSIWGCGSREGEGRRQRNERNRLTGVPGGPVSHSLRRGVHVWLTTDPGGALPSVLAVQNIRGVRDRSGRGTARHPHLSNIRNTRWSRGDGVVNVADVQLEINIALGGACTAT